MDQTKTYTIVADEETLLMFERLMAWLHWNSRWGHSGKVGMPHDGDGDSRFTVSEEVADKHREYVKGMDSQAGRDVEIVYADEV